MTTIEGETGTSGTAAIATRYPVETGLTAATTKQTGRIENLQPQGLNRVKSAIPERDKVGIDY